MTVENILTAKLIHVEDRNKVKKECYLIKQIRIIFLKFDNMIFLKYKTRHIKTTDIEVIYLN